LFNTTIHLVAINLTHAADKMPGAGEKRVQISLAAVARNAMNAAEKGLLSIILVAKPPWDSEHQEYQRRL